ncbi:S-layer homology domain-containing protein [Paenibacillus sp. LjRoot153]|uniref:S-layer homology domain-containing protein n=1 Tax=Paenibacillus sp. LjRoot153 TaxID=3342270 RepID=UPI003ECDD1F3
MSKSSWNKENINIKNKTHDIQGGEKKVMKKSLKVIATATLAFSMFASVAMAAETTTTPTATTTATTVKTSKDFKDLAGLDAATIAKIDAMLAKKYFEGTAEDSFGIKENMTRAQFAKVLVLVSGVPFDATVKTSSFGDVKADDTANGWAIPYIEAAKKAGLVDGKTDSSFDPSANVTLGEFATALVKGLGIKPDTTGTPWYADAIKQAVDKKLLPEGTDGSKFATRADLVVGAFTADAAIASVGKVSVTEAKAAGVYKVKVTFSKAVDTTLAKLALTKGTLAVSTSTTAPVWSEDKKSVTLTTDTRITEGDYTVTLSGLAADAVDKTTATFKATDETVNKIDFVNAGDTVAYSKVATIKLKATNQYDEAVSLGTSSFTALVSGQAPASFKKDADGNLVITANVSGTAGVTQGNGIIPVTVYLNNSNVTVSKNFKVGTVPILSKIEAGKVTYPNSGTKLAAKDETASIALNLIDQYGNAIVKSQLQPIDITPNDGLNNPVAEISASTINPVITPYEQKLAVVRTNNDYTDFFDDNDNARIKVQLTEKLDKSADYTVNIYGGSSSATATISVGAANLATKFEFDAAAVVIAAGDTTTVVPLIATDANGNKLSAQDIVDQKTRFNITASNATAAIVETGSDKGKVKLTYTGTNTVGGKVYVSGTINQSQTNTFVQTSIAISDARVPERISVTTEPTAKAILGADSEVVYMLKDQYGKDVKNIAATIPSANGQTSQYQVKVVVTATGTTGISFKGAQDLTNTDTSDDAALPTGTATGTNETTYVFGPSQLVYFNKGFNLLTNTAEGKVTVKATIEKAPNGTSNFSDYSSSVTRSLESIKPDTALTYSLNTVGSLFAAKDKFASNAAVVGTNPGQAADGLVAGNSRFDKKLGVVAKDSAGNTVKLPLNYVRGISSSDPNVLAVDTYTTGGVEDGYILGNKAGTATVSAVVYTNKGQTLNLTQEITVKADTITVETMTADNSTATYAAGNNYAYKYFNNLKVVDNYGIEYKTDATAGTDPIAQYFAVLGVQYTVQTLQGTGSVTINSSTGAITNVPAAVTEFLITAIAPNGKSLTMLVSK